MHHTLCIFAMSNRSVRHLQSYIRAQLDKVIVVWQLTNRIMFQLAVKELTTGLKNVTVYQILPLLRSQTSSQSVDQWSKIRPQLLSN